MGAVVGVRLAAPQIGTLLVNPSFALKSGGWFALMGAVYLVMNCLVGVLAALNFRKPI